MLFFFPLHTERIRMTLKYKEGNSCHWLTFREKKVTCAVHRAADEADSNVKNTGKRKGHTGGGLPFLLVVRRPLLPEPAPNVPGVSQASLGGDA